jgi:hypothetical protein
LKRFFLRETGEVAPYCDIIRKNETKFKYRSQKQMKRETRAPKTREQGCPESQKQMKGETRASY